MLREVEGAWVHVVLLEQTVAIVTTADVVVVVATVLLVSACFSISQVTHRFSSGETGEVKQTLINS